MLAGLHSGAEVLSNALSTASPQEVRTFLGCLAESELGQQLTFILRPRLLMHASCSVPASPYLNLKLMDVP